MATSFDLFFCIAGIQNAGYALKRLAGYGAAGAVLAGGVVATPGARAPVAKRIRIRADDLPVLLTHDGFLELPASTPKFSPGAPTISIPAGQEIELSLDGAPLGGLGTLIRGVFLDASVGGFVAIRVEP